MISAWARPFNVPGKLDFLTTRIKARWWANHFNFVFAGYVTVEIDTYSIVDFLITSLREQILW